MSLQVEKNMKKIISSLLILMMSVVLVPSAKISAQDYKNEIVIGDFNYVSDVDIYTDRFYYSDSYFEKSSYNLDDPHLRTMSLVLALATFADDGLEKKDTYVRDVMTKINLKDIEAVDMEGSLEDSIGTMIGHKDLGTNQLVTVVIRGGGYGKEWASNVTVGTEGDAAGFADGASKTIARIKEYLSVHNITNPKIWIAGYSRAAAVANLASVYINKHLDEFSGMTGNDLYAYCFETPAAVNDASVQYENIHHVINCNDPIIYLLPSGWQMYRNGVVQTTGDQDKIITGRQLSMDGGGISFAYAKEVKETDFLKSLVKLLSDTTTRDRYCIYQDNMRNALSFYAGLSSEELKTLTDSFGPFVDVLKENAMTLAFTALGIISEPGPENEGYASLTETLIDLYKASFGENQIPETCTGFIAFAQNNLENILKLLGPILSADFTYELDYTYGENYDPNIPREIDDIPSLFDFDGLFSETEGVKTINQEVVDDYIASVENTGKMIGYHLGYDVGYNEAEDIDPETFKEYFTCIYEVDEKTGKKIFKAFSSSFTNSFYDGKTHGGYALAGSGPTPLFHVATLFSNLSEIIGPHYPKAAMDTVKSSDSYYELSNELVTEDMNYLDTSVFYNRTNNENYTIRTDRGYAQIPAGNAVDMEIPASPAALVFECDLEDVVDYPAGSLCYFYGGEVSEADLEILKNAMKENDGLGYFALELDIRIKDEHGERSAQLTKGNILVSIEVPDGFIQEGDMEYFVLHLKKDGKVELIPAELTGNYLRFRINSLSPFLFTFKKKIRRYQIPVTGIK